MPLEKQLLPLPIVGGLDQKLDALLSARPQQMTNCMHRKTGAVSKRFGYECIGSGNVRSDASIPPVGESLCTHGGELIRIGGGMLDTYNESAGGDWMYRGRVSECLVECDGIVATGINATPYTNPQTATASGYAVTSYVSYDGTTYRVFVDVSSIATGARVFSRYQLASSATALTKPTVVSSGAMAAVFWGDGASSTLKGAFLTLTTMAWGTIATAGSGVTAAGLTGFDAVAVDATHVVFVIDTALGPVFYGIGPTITAGAFVPFLGALYLNADAGATVFSLRRTASRFWIAYGIPVGGLATVKVATVTLAYALETAPFVLFQDPTGGRNMTTVGIEAITATTAVTVYNVDGLYSGWAQCLNTGTPSSLRVALNAQWLTLPLVRNGRAYAVIANQHRTVGGSQFLVDLSVGESMPTNGSPRIVAHFLPQQLPTLYQRQVRYRTLSNWAVLGTDQWLATTLTAGTSATSLAVVGVKVRFDAQWVRTTAALSSALLIGGGALQAYDGSQVVEVGFAYAPDGDLFAPAPAAGGALIASSSYGYKFCYAWQDATGAIHRSAPSAAQAVAMGVGQTRVVGNAPCLLLTNKGGTSANAPVKIEVYRTVTAGSTYYYLTSVTNNAAVESVAFTDDAADASISSGPTIYTTGGVKQSDMPAGGANVIAWKGGVILAASDDDSLWISREVLAGEGPAFNAELNIAPFENGRITALGRLDDTPVVFKADSTFYLAGDPPTDTGVSNIGAPRRVQTEAGCTDARSVVGTSRGLARRARTGIYLLNSSLQDVAIGKAVEDSYRGSFVGAAVLPSQGLVRWLQSGTTGVDALNLDTHHTELYGTPVWSQDVLYDFQPSTLYDAADPVACTVWNGAFVWLSRTGMTYRETTAYLDGTLYVPMTFETAFAKPAGLSAYQRVYRAYVVGERRSAHGATMTLTSDVATESRTWTTDDITALGLDRLMVHVANQKCQWMKVKIADVTPAAVGTGEGLAIRDVSVLLGVKPGGSRLASKK